MTELRFTFFHQSCTQLCFRLGHVPTISCQLIDFRFGLDKSAFYFASSLLKMAKAAWSVCVCACVLFSFFWLAIHSKFNFQNGRKKSVSNQQTKQSSSLHFRWTMGPMLNKLKTMLHLSQIAWNGRMKSKWKQERLVLLERRLFNRAATTTARTHEKKKKHASDSLKWHY